MKTLFGLPYYKNNINENCFSKFEIVKTIEENYKKDNFRNKFNFSNLHHLYEDYDNPNFKIVDFKSLIDVYTEEINKFFLQFEFINNYRFEFQIVNYTAMNKAGQFFNNHVHSDCDFNAIHYLKFNKKNHIPTLYKNPYNIGSHLCYFYQNFKKLYNYNEILNEKNIWTETDYMIDVQENDFVITPSFLEHSVPSQIHDCDELRITIVLGIKLL